jgi:methylenetetrahydrofolate dehydrogenase (NADP+)/methenyltetrahydrofolate cyclohydrolase
MAHRQDFHTALARCTFADMTAKLIDGKKWAEAIRAEIREGVEALAKTFRPPGLGVVLVGEDPASRIYVTKKEQACEEVGIKSIEAKLPATVSTAEVLSKVQEFNQDDTLDGILVQLPLPKHVNEEQVLRAVLPDKDVDGFHPENVGLLWIGKPRFVSCTPAGILELLDREGVEIEGKRAVVVGRSNIVGKPMASLLLARHATVTICHSRTPVLQVVCHSADILVAAVGKPQMIRGDWVKPGAVVIDVGINRLPAEGDKKSKLVGDVCFEEAAQKASLITPVPGGVGPMTIAMLLKSTLISAQRRSKAQQ